MLRPLVERLPILSAAVPPAYQSPPTVHPTVPPILHCVVAPTSKATGDLRPSLTHLPDQPLNHHTLFRRNRLVVQARFQILMEAFSALFRCPRPDYVRDANPVVRTLRRDELQQPRVLLLRPRSPLVRGHADDMPSQSSLLIHGEHFA